MQGGWTYIMTNTARGVLYIGVTANLPARVLQHRNGEGADFSRRYKLTRLVLAEPHATIEDAIAREKALKAWKRGVEDRAGRGGQSRLAGFVGRHQQLRRPGRRSQLSLG